MLGSSVASILASISVIMPSGGYGPGKKTSGLRRTGVKYPHSSKRQQARYARNIAAGRYDAAQFRR